MSDEHHDDIQMPAPNAGPFVLGLGLAMMAAGAVEVWRVLLPVGLATVLVGGWVTTHRSKSDLEVDHHFEEEYNKWLPAVNLRKLGMWVFLASEVMFFAALISTFLSYRQRDEFQHVPVSREAYAEHHAEAPAAYAEDDAFTLPPDEMLNLPLVALNTFILLGSSFTAANAYDALKHGRRGTFRNMLIATLALGAIFLSIQGYEWYELMEHYGVKPDTLFGSAFFTTTGFHGMHVFIGLLWVTFILVRVVFRGAYRPEQAASIELFGLYWHFVDVVWIVLFTLIYLI
jgi:heme/copper-type cytochrome/quinol oxidase subunit 3